MSWVLRSVFSSAQPVTWLDNENTNWQHSFVDVTSNNIFSMTVCVMPLQSSSILLIPNSTKYSCSAYAFSLSFVLIQLLECQWIICHFVFVIKPNLFSSHHKNKNKTRTKIVRRKERKLLCWMAFLFYYRCCYFSYWCFFFHFKFGQQKKTKHCLIQMSPNHFEIHHQ